MNPDERSASRLQYLDEVLRRSRTQVDPRAFHFEHWGWIVLIWYPLAHLRLTAKGRRAFLQHVE
ncbi:MAG TPA: hypothetical protein VGB13_07675 [Candidatus Krumholzibacteria bacterium]